MKTFLCHFLLWLPLFAQAQSTKIETVIQRGHSKYVSCAAFSSDNKYIATGSQDFTIKIWNRSSGKQIRELSRHTARIRSVQFSSDGKNILSVGADNKAILFETISGKVLHEFKLDADIIIKAVFSLDGSRVIASSHRNETTVWETKTGKKLGKWQKAFDNRAKSNWIDPTGNKLIVFSKYDHAFVKDILSDKELLKLEFDKMYSMEFSRDGKYIVLGSTKLFAKVYDAATGKEIYRLEGDAKAKCDGCKTKISISNDSRFVLTGSKKGGVFLWDLRKGKKLVSFPKQTERISYLKFSQNGNQVLIGNDKGVDLYSRSGKLIKSIKGKFYSNYEVEFSTDGKFFLTPGENYTALLRSSSSGAKVREFSGYLNQKRTDGLSFSYSNWTDSKILKFLSMKSQVALSPDGKYFVRGNIDSTVFMFDINTGKVVQQFNGHTKVVYSYDFSPDGKQLVTCGGNEWVRLWDVKSGKLVRKFKGHRDLVFDVKFNSDGTEIVSGAWDGSARRWDVATGEMLKFIDNGNSSPYVVDFTNNDLYILTGDLGNKTKMWEADAGEVFRSYVGHTDLTSGISFSPDGERMATSSWDGKVKVWDVKSGLLLGKMSHDGSVYSIAYDPKNRFIVSSGADRTIRLWNPETFKEEAKLLGHSNAVTCVRITNDGQRLMSCTVDGEIKVWDLASKSELYTYIRIGRNDWLVKNEAGFFDGSKNALKLVNYVSGMNVVPVGSLFEKYYTPGLQKKIMSGEKIEGTGMNMDEQIKNSPTISLNIPKEGNKIETKEEGTIVSKKNILNLEANLVSPEGELDELRIYNNGKLVVSQSLGAIRFRGGSQKTRSVELKLNNGLNTISAIAINKQRVESPAKELKVFFDGEAAKTDLYIISVGINDYKNNNYDLNFAVNDAKTFTKRVKKGADSLFNTVNEYFIKDDEANKEGIKKAFDEVTSKVGSEDVFLFYYAGHGLMSVEEKERPADFFIVTHDVTNFYGDNEQLRTKAISAVELMEYSRKISAEKQLFILDACQSGGAIGAFAQRGVSREKALAQLARSTGTFFLTASQDIQYANEAGNLKHGLFTYALLEALEGKADGGLNDKKITVNEMKTYVEERVPELSEEHNGTAQYPTSYSFGQDFPIVIVR